MALACVSDPANLRGLEAHLISLETFRDWLASLVQAQQPLEEWSLTLEELRLRWLPREQSHRIHEGVKTSRLFF
jgi:hypothetical protein